MSNYPKDSFSTEAGHLATSQGTPVAQRGKGSR